jgi:effector-binding domain-containing protein
MPEEITVRELEEVEGLSVRETVSETETIGELIQDALGGVFHHGLELAAGPIAVYHELKPGRIDVEVVCPVAGYAGAPLETPSDRKLEPRTLESCRAAVMTFVGPYEDLGSAYGILMAWIGDHGYRMDGPSQEVYLTGPDEPGPPQTEIRVPVARTSQGG